MHRMSIGGVEYDNAIAAHLDPGASRSAIRVDIAEFPDVTSLVRIFSVEDLDKLGHM